MDVLKKLDTALQDGAPLISMKVAHLVYTPDKAPRVFLFFGPLLSMSTSVPFPAEPVEGLRLPLTQHFCMMIL